MSELRPIGTEFWYEGRAPTFRQMAKTTKNPYRERIKFRVVGHSQVARFRGDNEGVPSEVVECIDQQRIPYDAVLGFDGEMHYYPLNDCYFQNAVTVSEVLADHDQSGPGIGATSGGAGGGMRAGGISK